MDITIRSRDLAQLAKDLRQDPDGKALRKELVAGIRTGTKPAAAAVKAAYLGLPSKRGKGQLRRELARAVQVQVRTSGFQAGVRIRTAGSRMPPGKGVLPKRMEGIGRWRHPVFGHDRWVTQAPHPSFYKTLEQLKPQVVQAVQEVAARVERRIAGRGA